MKYCVRKGSCVGSIRVSACSYNATTHVFPRKESGWIAKRHHYLICSDTDTFQIRKYFSKYVPRFLRSSILRKVRVLTYSMKQSPS
jgi:hypothetical protein